MKLTKEKQDQLVAQTIAFLQLDASQIKSDLVSVIYKAAVQNQSPSSASTLSVDELTSLKQIHDFLTKLDELTT